MYFLLLEKYKHTTNQPTLSNIECLSTLIRLQVAVCRQSREILFHYIQWAALLCRTTSQSDITLDYCYSFTDGNTRIPFTQLNTSVSQYKTLEQRNIQVEHPQPHKLLNFYAVQKQCVFAAIL